MHRASRVLTLSFLALAALGACKKKQPEVAVTPVADPASTQRRRPLRRPRRATRHAGIRSRGRTMRTRDAGPLQAARGTLTATIYFDYDASDITDDVAREARREGADPVAERGHPHPHRRPHRQPWLRRVQPRARPAPRGGGEALPHRSRHRRRPHRDRELRRGARDVHATRPNRAGRRTVATSSRSRPARSPPCKPPAGSQQVRDARYAFRLAPVALALATGACFATRSDVRILQEDMAAASAAMLKADSARAAQIAQMATTLGQVTDSVRSANARIARMAGERARAISARSRSSSSRCSS